MAAEDPGSDGRWAPRDEPPSTPPPLDETAPQRLRWKVNLVLFLATVASTFLTGALYVDKDDQLWGPGWLPAHGWLPVLRALPSGWRFAVPLLAILLTHEFGHYIAARVHRIEASLPYFIPFPIFSPFGTMGAVIAMRGRIRSRDALLDIGASGPLAGLCVAVPVLVAGLAESPVEALTPGVHSWLEGQCLLYMAIKRVVLGPIPPGHDVFLTPMAFAGWAGLFVTMLNLVAVAQLDGGHIAYALFGLRQNRYARILHRLLLVIFAGNVVRFAWPLLARRDFADLGQALGNASFWLVWYFLIGLVMRLGGRDHPPTEPGQLSPVRKALAVLSLVLFVLLFMPTPYTHN
jgi:membrane-associated protease RseP (regulator of RpoE activity)